ncbi:hypothetical protein ACFQZE_24435 [Paenibacillus sp. GCM10027627]|uniref:hypothetical protein n=1 Tax=unclassified Paenibacillus TaxID=185978 RepID=UPI0036399672
MSFVIEGDTVLSVSEIKTRTQTVTVMAYHDMVYNSKLTTDKAKIAPNNTEFATVTARIFSWDGNFRVGDNRPVIFMINGIKMQPVNAVNGIASIQVRASSLEQIVVKTANAELRNGDVVING